MQILELIMLAAVLWLLVSQRGGSGGLPIVGRRPKFYKRFQEDKTLRLPGF